MLDWMMREHHCETELRGNWSYFGGLNLREPSAVDMVLCVLSTALPSGGKQLSKKPNADPHASYGSIQ